jgi:hypothetical protein
MQHLGELLHRLRKPRRFPAPPGPTAPEATSDDDWAERRQLYEADESPPPEPALPVAEGAERHALREELRQCAAAELEVIRQVWEKKIAVEEAPFSIQDRDELALDVRKDTELLRRQEESCFREFWRLGNLLMKLQDREAETESKSRPAAQSRCPESLSGKSLRAAGRSPESEGRSARSEVQTESTEPEVGEQSPEMEAAHLTPDTLHLIPDFEGASGYVDENTEREGAQGTTNCHASGPGSTPVRSPAGGRSVELRAEERPRAAEAPVEGGLPARGQPQGSGVV